MEDEVELQLQPFQEQIPDYSHSELLHFLAASPSSQESTNKAYPHSKLLHLLAMLLPGQEFMNQDIANGVPPHRKLLYVLTKQPLSQEFASKLTSILSCFISSRCYFWSRILQTRCSDKTVKPIGMLSSMDRHSSSMVQMNFPSEANGPKCHHKSVRGCILNSA